MDQFVPPIRNRLDDYLKARGIKRADFARMCGVNQKRIDRLIRGDNQGVDFDVLARVCGALEVQISDLFVVELENLWTHARLVEEVHLYIGSSAMEAGRGEKVGSFDVLADTELGDHVADLGGIRLRRHMYPNGRPTAPGSGHPGAKHWLLKEKFSCVVGSPASNLMSEEFVAQICYRVPPHSPAFNTVFPFVFRYPRNKLVSSFSCEGDERDSGIIDPRTGEQVARRTYAGVRGIGYDCGLIVVYRVPPMRYEAAPGAHDGIVVLCLGHGGPGSLACAKVVTDPANAALLYPKKAGEPLMRVVTAETYSPHAGLQPSDDRRLISYSLV